MFFSSFSGQSSEDEILLDHCHKLLEKFHYPWEMMPLMYVIVKDAGGILEEASRRIDEGKYIEKSLIIHLVLQQMVCMMNLKTCAYV